VDLPIYNKITTPLSHAVGNGDEEVVKLLLENGAQPDLEDEDGKTPLSRALFEGHAGVIRLLKQKIRKDKVINDSLLSGEFQEGLLNLFTP
jgi:ankyrin repeat protein